MSCGVSTGTWETTRDALVSAQAGPAAVQVKLEGGRADHAGGDDHEADDDDDEDALPGLEAPVEAAAARGEKREAAPPCAAASELGLLGFVFGMVECGVDRLLGDGTVAAPPSPWAAAAALKDEPAQQSRAKKRAKRSR